MKKVNPDREENTKSPQGERAMSCAAAGAAAESSSGGSEKNRPSEKAAERGVAVSWNRYCDSRLKQFCVR